MSFREKIRLNFPLYFVLSLLFSVAIWSLWFPNWFGSPEEAEASPVTNFSTSITTSPRVPSGAEVKVAYNNGVYAMVFSSSTVTATSATTTCAYASSGTGPQACKIFFTKSTDGGTTWSSPVQVTANLFFSTNHEKISSFSYDERRGVWVVTYKEYGNFDDIVQSFSADGATWTTRTVISDTGVTGHYLGRTSAIAFSTSSDLRAVLVQKGDYLVVGTTTNTGLTTSWPTSTVEYFNGWKNTQSGDWEGAVRPLGISIDGQNTIHAVYAMASTSASFGYNIIYASSTNLGLTWTTSSISGKMSLFNSNFACLECGLNTTAIDPYTGRLSVMYYQATDANMALVSSNIFSATTSLFVGQLGTNGVWTTSTLTTQLPLYYTIVGTGAIAPQGNGLTVPYTGMYASAFFATGTNPYFTVNTSTLVTERVNTDALSHLSEISTDYNSTTKELALAYVDSTSYRVKFTTTSLRIAQVNDPATTTAMTISDQPRNASGIMTFSTTVGDLNHEDVTLYVDYSLDHGLTWASTTIASATGEGGSLSTATGRINGITTSDGDQAISFTWDTSAILAASSTSAVRIRVLADDGYSYSNYRQTASFTVDNQAPGLPSELVLTSVETNSLTLIWTSSTGTPTLYMASSTAATATATTTSATTTDYTNLSPNTQYLFQVKAQDLYSNTSTYSAVTSTYTDASTPTAISASNNGSDSLVVTWTSDNGTGTNYQLYNVTTGAVVATTTDTTYTVTGLSASTEYQFKVRAQFLADNDTYSDYTSNSTGVSTSAAASSGGGGGGGGGGGAAPLAAPPAIPVSLPATPSQTDNLSLSLNVPVTQSIGASQHTFTAQAVSAQNLTLKIESDPIVVNLAVNTPKNVDTNKDNIADLRVVYGGLVQNKPKITVTSLTDENELKNPFTIQAGAYETTSRAVKVMINGAGVVQVALSNTADFAGSSFVSYQKEMNWTLSPGNGQKTVYAKLRSAQGGMVTISDTISLASTGTEPVVNDPITAPPVVTSPTVVVPPLTRTLKRNMTGAEVKQFQLELQKQGYFPKNVVANSVFGPTTEASVKAFEKAKGIKIDGIVDTATWQVIFGGQVNAPAEQPKPTTTTPAQKNLYKGNSGAEVLWVQQKLQTLGFFPKTTAPNGYFGPATFASVKAFQKAKGISQTGNVGPLTWSALNK